MSSCRTSDRSTSDVATPIVQRGRGHPCLRIGIGFAEAPTLALASPQNRKRRHGVVEAPSPEDLESGQKRGRRIGVVEPPTMEELESPKRRRLQAGPGGPARLPVSSWSAEDVTDYLQDRGISETLLQVFEGEQAVCSLASCLQGENPSDCVWSSLWD